MEHNLLLAFEPTNKFMLVPAILIGLASTIFTELLKIFPSINTTDLRKRITALVVSVVISGLYLMSGGREEGLDALGFILLACSFSFAIYKSVIQGIVEPTIAFIAKLRSA